jgi:hypothetical protein
MQNVVFYFRRKTGIKMTDLGLADVVFDGEGLTVSFLSFIYIVVKQRSRKLYTLPSISFLQAKIECWCSSSPSGTRSVTCYTKPSSHSPPLSSRNRSRKLSGDLLRPVWGTLMDNLSALGTVWPDRRRESQ